MSKFKKNRIIQKPDEIIIEYIQDPAEIYQHNHLQRLYTDENWAKDKDIKFLGRIPLAEYFKMQDLGITEDDKALENAIKLNENLRGTNKF